MLFFYGKIAGFGGVYFETPNDKSQEMRALTEGYKAIINSKSVEESLVSNHIWIKGLIINVSVVLICFCIL